MTYERSHPILSLDIITVFDFVAKLSQIFRFINRMNNDKFHP